MQPHRMIPVRCALRRHRCRATRGRAVHRSAVRERGQALVLFVADVPRDDRLGRHRHRHLVALVRQPADAARGGRRGARGCHLPARQSHAGLLHGAGRGDQERLHDGLDGVTVTPLQDATNQRGAWSPCPGRVNSFFAQALGISSFGTQASSQGGVRAAGADGQPRRLLRRRRLPGHGHQYQCRQQLGQYRLAYPDRPTEHRLDHAPERGPDRQQRLRSGALHGELRPAVEHVRLHGATTSPTQPGASSRCRHPAPGRPSPSTASSSSSRPLLTGSGSTNNCKLQAELSWNAGTNWTTRSLHARP